MRTRQSVLADRSEPARFDGNVGIGDRWLRVQVSASPAVLLRKTSWWECLQGGLLAGIFWEGGRFVLTLFLLRGAYDAYGVIGSFIAIMLWFYYAWTVLLFGAEIRAGIASNARRHGTPHTPPPRRPRYIEIFLAADWDRRYRTNGRSAAQISSPWTKQGTEFAGTQILPFYLPH